MKTNYYESRADAATYLFLYDSVNEKILNKIALASGEYLEIALVGYSTIQIRTSNERLKCVVAERALSERLSNYLLENTKR